MNFSEECSSKGGSNGGSCASGFGVCCTCKYLDLYCMYDIVYDLKVRVLEQCQKYLSF